jgi:adenine phosphoribosyltransferase
MDLRQKIRDIHDFPKPGIIFKDVTPLLADGAALMEAVDRMAESVAKARPDLIVAIESRGFIFGAGVATRLGVGMIPVRKPGKLPYRTRRETYALEYGTDSLEIHEDAIVPGAGVVIVDDVLATGGTAAATARLCEHAGARVLGFSFLIELGFLGGRPRLGNYPVSAVLCYD